MSAITSQQGFSRKLFLVEKFAFLMTMLGKHGYQMEKTRKPYVSSDFIILFRDKKTLFPAILLQFLCFVEAYGKCMWAHMHTNVLVMLHNTFYDILCISSNIISET